MSFDSGSQYRLAISPETVRGTTDATPAFETLEVTTGVSLAVNRESIQSNSLRDDRQIACFKLGARSAGGTVPVEYRYGQYDSLIEAAFAGSWVTDTPAPGVDQLDVGKTQRSFTVEEFFGTSGSYIRYTGQEVSAMAITIDSNAQVTCEFTLVGRDGATDTSAIAGSTYPPITHTCPFDSFSGVMKEGGATVANITSLSINLDNGAEQKYAVGSSSVAEITLSLSNVTGTLSAYQEDLTLLNKFLDGTPTTIEVQLVDDLGNQQIHYLYNVIYTGASNTISETDVITELPFQALYDETEQTNYRIERIAI